MVRYFVGLDLGQVHDYTAVVVVERLEISDGEVSRYSGKAKTVTHYHLRHLFQPPQCQAVNPSRWSTLAPPFTEGGVSS